MEDIFAETVFGKLALKKMGALPEGFKLFEAGWLGKHPNYYAMEVKGCVFREAKSGKRKGQKCIAVPGTERRAMVTPAEMCAFADKGAA